MQTILHLERMQTREVIEAARREWEKDELGVETSTATYELFRRAFVLSDEAAWETLYNQYYNLIASWINKRMALPLDLYPSAINDVWMKMFIATREASKFANFPCLGALLGYLKMCAATMCTDRIRAASREMIQVSLSEVAEEEYVDEMPEEEILEDMQFQQLLVFLEQQTHNEKERVILHAMLIQGEKPSMLQKRYPTLFTCREDIYWTRRHLVERWRRNATLKAHQEQMA